MPSKVVLKFTKGSRAGSELTYTGKEVLFLGRDGNDCNLVLPEQTVSRIHCFLEIVAPEIRVHDFGSLNGTYLNGTLIGKRPLAMPVEEGRKLPHNDFPLHSGDRLSLGNDCEFVVDIHVAQRCAHCDCEVDQPLFADGQQLPLCAGCHKKEQERIKAELDALKKLEQERIKAEKEAKKQAEKIKAEKDAAARKKAEEERREAGRIARIAQEKEKEALRKAAEEEEERKRSGGAKPVCRMCGATLPKNHPAPLCVNCQNDPLNALGNVLKEANRGVENLRELAGYQNIKQLGRGGMGAVMLVKDTGSGNEMAMKVMLPSSIGNEFSRRRFLREAHVAGQLNHKNVIKQFKCGCFNDHIYYILMEYCKDGSVDRLIARNNRKLGFEQATDIILQTLDGLHYVHNTPAKAMTIGGETFPSSGIVHRDFKPANIFLEGKTCKVADFGLAKGFDAAGYSGFTHVGEKAGSMAFMPRQQVIDFGGSKPEVDVWAAAATYYYMLTGCFVRNFTESDDWTGQVLKLPVIPIRMRDPKIPQRLADVIDEALVEKPAIRIKTAAELKKNIKAVL
jgi:serine/threonine-protein kinase